jgi:hypothetical protein
VIFGLLAFTLVLLLLLAIVLVSIRRERRAYHAEDKPATLEGYRSVRKGH